jgi:trimethylamine--corrinoid protein Co-methyltransferase
VPPSLCLPIVPAAGLDQIESVALRLLAEVGIALQHERVAEMLHGLGCRLEGGRAYLPPQVVEQALRSVTPGNFAHSADGRREVRLGPGRFAAHNTGGEPNILDYHTGRRRLATTQDQAEATRLLDALPNVDIVVPLFAPQDVPDALMTIAGFDTMLRHTRKPISASAAENPNDVRFIIEMAAACCGGLEEFRRRPTISISVSPISPLTFSEKVAGAILAVAESGAGFKPLPCPSMGATGPITLAGVVALQFAENLAALVIAATARPGIRAGMCSRANPIDLRTAVSSWSGPEVGLASAVTAQLAQRYGLPCDVYGFCTAAAGVDAQYSYDKFANAVTPALAGAEVLSGMGMLESGLTSSLEALVVDDEIAGLIRQLQRGCEVTEATLAFDVIRETVAGDGVFLGHPHTVEFMRQGALWMGAISERGPAADDGALGMWARARERVAELLESHPVEPLPADVERHLDEIMTQARRELVA